MKIKNEKGKVKDVRLPKVFKKKWLAALRSGEFKQGEGNLEFKKEAFEKSDKEYCCLGVACRIMHPKMKFGNSGYLEGKRFENIKVPEILKGDDENIIVKKLSEMNDKGKSFKVIAAYIDKNL